MNEPPINIDDFKWGEVEEHLDNTTIAVQELEELMDYEISPAITGGASLNTVLDHVWDSVRGSLSVRDALKSSMVEVWLNDQDRNW